jgi:predicted Zn-dependent protease
MPSRTESDFQRWRPTAVRRSLLPLTFAASLAVGWALARPVMAHEGLHEQIAAVTKLLQAQPGNAGLHLKRGELHRLHRDWDAALADYERAAQLDSALPGVVLARARMMLDAGWPNAARATVEGFLAREPEHPEGRLLHARALARLGDRAAAVAAYDRAMAASRPGPELYLERARLLADGDASDQVAALRGLDEGIAQLGPLVTLELAAIDLELKARRYDAALARVDRLAAQTPRKETWLAKRGEILDRAGRRGEARQAYAAALTALDALPPHRRGVRAMADLEKSIRTALARPERKRPTR